MSRETIIDKELDEELIRVTLFIQSVYENKFGRHEQLRVEKWITKLAKISYNHEWKRRRNEYVCYLAEQVDRGYLTSPFDRSPPEGHLPPLHATGKSKAGGHLSSVLKNTDEIARLIEEQLGTVGDDPEVFNLSPRETEGELSKGANFNNTYEITPSKTNRLKSFRESAQVSKRENLQTSHRFGPQAKEATGDE